MFDLIHEIRQTLATNRLRTILTGIAVAWGIFMLIILVSISRGVFNSFEDSSSATAAANIEVYNGSTSMPYGGYKEGRRISLNVRDIPYLMEARPGQSFVVATRLGRQKKGRARRQGMWGL